MTGRSHLVSDKCWCGRDHVTRPLPINPPGMSNKDFINGWTEKDLMRNQSVYTLEELPDEIHFPEEDIPPIVTTSYIPVYLPDRVMIGKATVVEGLNDSAVIVEVECNPSIMPGLVKEGLVGVSFVYEAGVPAQGENDAAKESSQTPD